MKAVGDYTGGASEDLFTLASHGLSDGDIVFCVAQSAKGVVNGGVGLRAIVNALDANTFQLTSDGSTVIENSADGDAYFLKGNLVPQRVADAICERIFLVGNDTTGGTVEDMQSGQGTGKLEDGDTMKLLYKSAAGVSPTAADATLYVKSPVSTISATGQTGYWQTAATSGGSVQDTTADGFALYLKTS